MCCTADSPTVDLESYVANWISKYKTAILVFDAPLSVQSLLAGEIRFNCPNPESVMQVPSDSA